MKLKKGQFLRLLSVICSLTLFCCFVSKCCFAQDASLEEAKNFYKKAIELKAAGKTDEAVTIYEKAVRANRGILSEDDNGLIALLRAKYEKKLADSPNDIEALEGMGFIHAVCFAELPKAIECYEKLLTLTTDERVKTKTKNLLENLKAMLAETQRHQEEAASKGREERLKNWSELEKEEQLAAENEESQAKAEEYKETVQRKDELERRVSQLEQELKELQEEEDKADRLWFTLHDDLYSRRRDRARRAIPRKQEELEQAKAEFEEVKDQLKELEKDLPKDGSNAESDKPAPKKSEDGEEDDASQTEETGQSDEINEENGGNQQKPDEQTTNSEKNRDFPSQEQAAQTDNDANENPSDD